MVHEHNVKIYFDSNSTDKFVFWIFLSNPVNSKGYTKCFKLALVDQLEVSYHLASTQSCNLFASC